MIQSEVGCQKKMLFITNLGAKDDIVLGSFQEPIE
jgi:hypothetical protein